MLTVLLLLLLMTGCVSSGRKIQLELVREIRVGATTARQVTALFGEPASRTVSGQTERLTYVYARNSGFGSTSQRLEIGLENDVVVSCTFDTFDLNARGGPERSTSVPCARL